MARALPALEAAFRSVARGEAVNIPRHRGALAHATMNSMGAISTALDLMGVKVYPIVRSDVTVGSSFQVLVYRVSTGALVGVLEAEHLAQIRTGAASGVATKFMARPDSRVMTLFGAGWQARAQLDAIARVLPKLERVYVVGRSPERVQRFCSELGRDARCELVPSTDAQRALMVSDVVTTVTGSATPVFDGQWLRAGTHINAVGSNFAEKQEIDAATVARARRIVADDVDVAKIECGDLLHPSAAAAFAWNDVKPLSDVVAGLTPGRVAADDITLFESQGIGLEDIAMAHVILEQAALSGAGIEIPLQ
jgi:alanine dehydrogenase